MDSNEQMRANQIESKGLEKRKLRKDPHGKACEVWEEIECILEARAGLTDVPRGPGVLPGDPAVSLVFLSCRWCRGAGEGASQP